MYHERTKCNDVKYRFFREIASQGTVVVRKFSMSDNPTNMITKFVPLHKFKHFLDLILYLQYVNDCP
jgi:hypothetical protein